MTIQSSINIGEVIRNAVVFNIKNWSGGLMNSDSLTQSVQDLFAILEERKIDYVLVGGIALLHYIIIHQIYKICLMSLPSILIKMIWPK